MSEIFEYSELFLQIQTCWKLSNGLDDLKVVPRRMDNGIHLEHSYLEVLEKPLCSALKHFNFFCVSYSETGFKNMKIFSEVFLNVFSISTLSRTCYQATWNALLTEQFVQCTC